MKILTIADFFYPYIVGGSAIMAYELMREMVERGHEVTVLTRGNGEESDYEALEGMDVFRYRFSPNPLSYPLSAFRAVLKVRELIEGRGFDLINMHHASGGVAAEINNKLSNDIPTAFFFQGPWHGEAMAKDEQGAADEKLPLKYEMRKKVDRFILRNCDAVFCLSDYMRGEASAIYPLFAPKFHKISGGVDVERFVPATDKEGVRRALGLPADAVILLTVRRLAARMGLENLVRAMEVLGKARKDVVLLIGGKGELWGKLQDLIDELSLENTHLLGFIENDQLPQYYQASDLFVLPSEAMEGYGLITLEAFACGLPVLGTGTGAIPEIIEAALPGFIANGLEPEVLAENILRCLPLLSEVDKASLRSFAQDRSWARVADRIENVFQDISL